MNALPMVHHRWLQRIESDGTDAVEEVVTMSGHDADIGRTFTGDFSLEFLDSPVEELHRIAPREHIAGYWREVGVTWSGGTTLQRTSLEDI